MKTPNLFYRLLCCFFAAYLAVPASMVAQFALTTPTFPASNTVRLTLTGAQTNAAYLILFNPALTTNVPAWSRVVTGSVGQTTFDLAKTTNAAAFYIASDVPNLAPTVATPVFAPGGGTYAWPTNVTITCATEGAAIYYTTDGSTPTTLDTFIYNGDSVALASVVTLKARAFKNGYDDSAVASATYTINAGPVVSAGPQQIIAGSPATLAGFVADDGLTGGGTRFTNWSKLTGPGSVAFNNASQTNTTATFGADGIYVLQLAASDGQYTNASYVTIAVNPALSVSLTAPAAGSGYTVPTNLLLQAAASCTSGSVTQLLFYSGSSLIGVASNLLNGGFACEWRSVPEGTHALTAVAVSSDADNFSLASDLVAITVHWPTNVGQVTLALTDLQIPAAGLPITINRLYDTRRAGEGSFGQKWRLDWEDPKIEAASLTEGWEGFTSIQYCVRESSPHLVTVSLGENEKYYFAPRVLFNSTSQPCVNAANPLGYYGIFVNVVFDAVGGQGQLTVNSPGNLGLTPTGYDPGDGCLGTWFGPLKLATFEEDDFEICGAYATDWQPSLADFTFTGPDGTRYGFNADGTLASKTDRNGNALSYGSSSLYHSSGKLVTFTRDGNNRITEIYDPIAQDLGSVNPALKYDYDNIGNLTNVARLVQRSPAVYENTVYAYTNANFTSHLTSIKDARGVVAARYEYDSSGRLSKQYDALNRDTSYTYDLVNHRQIVTDRLSQATVQTFTASGQVASVTDANNGVTSYTYDERGRKISETNPQGQTTTFAYDANDQLAGVTNEVGGSTSATYNDFGQVLTSVDARGYGTTNGYDANGNLLAVTNALGSVTLYEYDYQGNRVTETSALGLPEEAITRYEFNAYGDLTKITDPLSHEITYTHDDNGNRLTETKTRTTGGGPETLLTQWNYDAANRAIETIDPANHTNRVVYNGLGKQAQTINALNRTNRYFYDAIGLLTNTTYADGLFERFSYDAESRRTESVDRAERATTYAYDSLGRPLRTTYPDTSFTRNVYDAAGRLTTTVQGAISSEIFPANELYTSYTYDAAGRRLTVVNQLLETNRFAYDANGNQTNVMDALGRAHLYDYDALNRQARLTYPDGTGESYDYDALNRRVGLTNQAGIVTRFGYDALGRLVAVTNAFATAQPLVARYTYDEVGNLIEQFDALNRTNLFEYDALGRRTRETLPASQSQTFGYDAVGNLARHTNFNGVVLTNQYDSLNRLTNKSSVGGYQIAYAYSPTGQRTDMTDASGTNTYTYSDRDRLLTKATPQGTLTYTYNSFGNLSRIQSDTVNGIKLTYRYDLLNRLTNVLDRFTNNTSYTFDSAGNLQTARYPNLVTNTWTYNALNRLTNVSVTTASGTIAAFAYKLAAAGNRTNLVENLNGSWRTNVWSYDPLYRLTNEVISGAAPAGAVSYKYDAVGNRTNRTSSVSGITNQTWAYSANDQLTTDVYDANGNTRTNGSNAYQYDVENRLTNYNSGTAIYVYDGDGNRVRKTVGGVTTYYLVDDRNPTGYAQVLEERTSTSTNLFAYGLDLISQRQSDGTTHCYGYDGNGNVRFLTAANATMSDTYVYDAFGIVITSTGSTPNNYRYSGEQYDANLGFYYLRARYMNPNSGRFMSRDSYAGNIFDPASLHRYTYCANNPINCVDPSGNMELATTLTAIGIGLLVASALYVGYKIYTAKFFTKARVAKALVNNSREATQDELKTIDDGFAMIGSYKFQSARGAIQDGVETVYIVETASVKHGAHVEVLKGKIFIPISKLKEGAARSAFYAFGEIQHDTWGNNLTEAEAQAQMDEIIKTLPAPFNTWRFKHGE